MRRDLPPGLDEFGAQLERAVERELEGEEGRRSRRPPRLLRAIGLPVAAALAAAAVTAGAVRIADREGPPIQPDKGGAITSLQPPEDPTVVFSSAVADPGGGPAWVVRVYSNPAGQDCVKLGRLRDGVFGQVQGGRFRKLPASAEGTCLPASSPRRALVAMERRGAVKLTAVFGISPDREPVSVRYRGRDRVVSPVALGAFLTLLGGADPSATIVVRTRVDGRVDERRFPYG